MTNYRRGTAIEYKLVHMHRDQGAIANRSAGSHSILDVFAVYPKERRIYFFQSKRSKRSKRKVAAQLPPSGLYHVTFKQVQWIDRKGFVDEAA